MDDHRGFDELEGGGAASRQFPRESGHRSLRRPHGIRRRRPPRPVGYAPLLESPPLAVSERTISSTPESRRSRLFSILDANDPSRSLDPSIGTEPTSVRSSFERVPLARCRLRGPRPRSLGGRDHQNPQPPDPSQAPAWSAWTLPRQTRPCRGLARGPVRPAVRRLRDPPPSAASRRHAHRNRPSAVLSSRAITRLSRPTRHTERTAPSPLHPPE